MLKRNNISGIGIGTTSVIMIFVVLCLSILATLLYTVTKSDEVVTDKKVGYATRYQLADNVAIETLAYIDEKLYELCEKNIPFYNYNSCRVILDSLENVSIDYKNKKIAYKVGLETNINLEVELPKKILLTLGL